MGASDASEEAFVKHRYLCCYDYGTGGVWVYVFAREQEEITAKYPKLTVIHQRPAWMTNDHEPSENMTFDIDAQPTGWITRMTPPERGPAPT